jgi:hypothetical protein
MKKLMFFLLAISYVSVYGQEVFLKTGMNYTSYNFSSYSAVPAVLEIQNGQGSFYELGINKFFNKGNNLGYKLSVTLNEYNALASSPLNNYTWNTSYLGVQGMVLYRPIKTARLNLDIHGGLLINKMVYGKQTINRMIYDLNSNIEFNGLYVHTTIGSEGDVKFSDKMSLLVGYQFSYSIIQNRSAEETYFLNHQIQFGIKYKL